MIAFAALEFWGVEVISPGNSVYVVPGGVFHLHPVTPLSFKSDDSDVVQNYFAIFWGKKNRDQIENEVTMTSSLL